MSITADGWLDWAERVVGDQGKQSGGRNTVMGFVAHSAEGGEGYLRAYNTLHSVYAGRRASWTFSNLKDGTLLQHFSIYAQVWASGAKYPNDNFVPMEHEGIAGEVLTPAQVRTTARVIKELSDVKGWEPVREVTLWEHKECRRWGADPTACPSDRIPWDAVLKELAPAPVEPPKERRMKDWAIVGLENDAPDAYLLKYNELYLIPNDPVIFEDLRKLIYEDEIIELHAVTWQYLDTIGVQRKL